ncbi:MAG: biotin--[acetyl-CoA-carboxylase] ligase [Sporomusaceae bacterium]|nr:biotin--[acetyl-CoA-carboxylase] ligase [Sporomusaceae bacterium]
MRAEILRVLKQNAGQYISGEEVSKSLKVSRTAIWKHMQALREEGYEIDSHPRQGYCLRTVPDLLLPDEVCPRLETEFVGHSVYYYTSISSTNNEAKRLANEGCADGSLILTEEQKAGRGRLARGWFSPYAKGIWCSVVLRPPFPPQEAPKCTLLAAVAIARAIRAAGVDCGIKWPNDILWQGKKLVGILTEMSAEMDAINYVVIGMGINVNTASEDFPPELREIAASLASIRGQAVSRTQLLVDLLRELESLYVQACREGFDAILKEWRALSVTLGQTVDIFGINRSFSGQAIDIDSEGALLVQTGDGIERVIAGDVSLRAKPQR